MKLFLKVNSKDFKLFENREILNSKKILEILIKILTSEISYFDKNNQIQNRKTLIISIMFKIFFINFNLSGHEKNLIKSSKIDHEKQKISISSNV